MVCLPNSFFIKQVVLNGVGPNGEFNAFVSPNDNDSYAPLSPGQLKGISKLISGAMNCNVRDMGGFTEDAEAPFAVRISMPDVLALMRQSWVYERFCQTKCRSMTVVVLRSQHSRGKDKLRVAWENSGSLDYTKAQVRCRHSFEFHVFGVWQLAEAVEYFAAKVRVVSCVGLYRVLTGPHPGCRRTFVCAV